MITEARAYVCDPLIEHNSLKLLRSDMQTEHIVALLIAERDRLSRAIEALRTEITESKGSELSSLDKRL